MTVDVSTWRRPVAFISLSALIGAVAGGIVFAVSGELVTALIGAGIAFIVALVSIAMAALAGHPDSAELLDLDEQNHPASPERDA